MKGFIWVALGAALVAPAPRLESKVPSPPPAQEVALVESPSGLVLSSRTSVEPLTGETEVSLQPDRTLRLTPGVRFTRTEEGYSLATHDGRKVEIEAGKERIALSSPVVARVTARGWEFGGDRPYPGSTLVARRHPLEETIEVPSSTPKQDRQPRTREVRRKLRIRWLYSEDPMPTAEVFNTEAIQQLVHLSPMGF